MQSLPTVREFMDTKVPTLLPSTLALDAVDFLLKNRVTGAPVVDEAGALLGIFTEKNCLNLVARSAEPESVQVCVSDLMTREVRTIPPSMDVYFAAGLFLKVAFRRFPVVEEGRIVGAITRFDILRAIQANREYLAANRTSNP
ncbi:MAG: CBS domain-containing protein [Gemmatimonadetes bacterium]|jgi:CBS domain-containing protein|nr:CBS domain-containing protein [Gemmatimonadota bacterium]